MYDKEELCKKIKELYPDIGECGMDLEAYFSTAKNSWVVELKKDNHTLKHHLAKPDVRDCMDGKQCVSLGLEIAELKRNIQGG